ncbi:mechanosensitive ion channel family protein, partial [Salmonella enterica]|nr:mechanosensitive ion channel family protein [Salmonella enterica]
LLTGLGASAAIMSLVFKETIQSLVSGIQLSANDMVAVGDWIVVPKASANGVVIEMNLNTVKIRNWDNTITTVPPSTLLSDSFTNWKGMSESAGRRLNRSICIDMDTVRFVNPDEEKHFAQMPELYYFFERRKNDETGYLDPLTNLTLFREYIYAYLMRNPAIHDPDDSIRMKLMVRYLQPTQYGMPVELYCFTKTKVWPEHEAIIAQLMDHMIASLSVFGLRPYQVASSKGGQKEGLSEPVKASMLAIEGRSGIEDGARPDGGAGA